MRVDYEDGGSIRCLVARFYAKPLTEISSVCLHLTLPITKRPPHLKARRTEPGMIYYGVLVYVEKRRTGHESVSLVHY